MKKIFPGGFYRAFFFRIFFAFVLFTLTRILFYLFNFSFFQEIKTAELLKILFYGLRFDTPAVIVCYSLFILLSIFPLHIKSKIFYQRILLFVYTVSTMTAMSANLLDCGYFSFTLSRTTSDIFNVLALGSDFFTLLPSYIRDFWYLFLIWLLLIFAAVLFFANGKVAEIKKIKSLPVFYLKETLMFLLISGLCILGFRGGIQLRPISIVSAGQYVQAKNVSLILNTPFTIIKTIGKSGLKNTRYFDEKTLQKLYSPLHNYYKKGEPAKAKNVVVIILESFSKEYIGELNRHIDNGKYKGYTPFLDSLIKQSLYFPNAYANGKRSIEAIPAVLAGIPSLMSDAFITSVYSGNNFNSLASVLKNEGYTSSFFHGGTNGTMGFDNFISLAGFGKYYGRTEYNNEKDFDGKWGIYDEEFLQFVADKLDKTSKPFIAGIFTLSSHHPYKVPEKYSVKFPKGMLPIFQSIMYADYSLGKFFDAVSKTIWSDSTLFVITADHTSESVYPQYQTRSGMYAVPVIFYQRNSNLKGECKIITQQTDIMPSVLDYINYGKPFIAFGESVFDTSANHFSVSFANETYQLIYKNFSLIFDGAKSVSLYDLSKDSLMTNDIIDSYPSIKKEAEGKVKAIIQSYNQRMIRNDMICK